MRFDELPTPCFVVDEAKLKANLEILQELQTSTGCKVLLAQKAFSMYSLYPLIGSYLSGTSASGLYEARLGHDYMGGETHVFAPAFKDADMAELVELCDHIIFNSFNQYEHHRNTVAAERERRLDAGDCGPSIGLRINPQCSTQKGHEIYDPCAPGSRLGITVDEFHKGLQKLDVPSYGLGLYKLPDDIEGLHFHTLCEQDADDLQTTFCAVEERFKFYLKQVKWINLGGGHHITRPGYHIEKLKQLISYIQSEYGLEVYIEPGEAVALNAGYLVCEVCDIVHNNIDTLILDTSAECHMPDVLEMPYRPPLQNSFPANEKPFTYRLSSLTCLAGDIIGEYSFDHEIHVGDRLVFEDMAIYSMVKTNTFNGMPLPGIAILHEDGQVQMVKEFGYDDFKNRLS